MRFLCIIRTLLHLVHYHDGIIAIFVPSRILKYILVPTYTLFAMETFTRVCSRRTFVRKGDMAVVHSTHSDRECVIRNLLCCSFNSVCDVAWKCFNKLETRKSSGLQKQSHVARVSLYTIVQYTGLQRRYLYGE